MGAEKKVNYRKIIADQVFDASSAANVLGCDECKVTLIARDPKNPYAFSVTVKDGESTTKNFRVIVKEFDR
jgi:hypothetical protein